MFLTYSDDMIFGMKISAQKAAGLLGVSRMQISRLVSAGEIRSERFGNALQIDLDSVHRYQDLRPAPGRPAAPASAWQLLADARPSNLEDLKALAVAARRRSERHEVRVLPGLLDELLADPRLVVSGAAAAAHHGAAVRDVPPHVVYVRDSDYLAVARRYRMRDDADDANVIVKVAPDSAWLFDSGLYVPLVVALVDLVDDRDDRSAAEALRSLL